MTDSGLSGRPADSLDPIFFHSYGCVPVAGRASAPDERQQQFHSKLVDFVMRLTTYPGTTPVGFMDKGILLGSEWEKDLKQALATCRVFMPVYSPRYFNSSWCGMEWDGFVRRLEEHRRSEPYTVSPIVPVLWTNPDLLTLPAAVQPYQYHHEDLDEAYRREGLLGLMEAGKWPSYRRTVWRIAERIVHVARAAQWKPCDTGLFDDLRNAFETGDQGDT